jgi:hypothetical protein
MLVHVSLLAVAINTAQKSVPDFQGTADSMNRTLDKFATIKKDLPDKTVSDLKSDGQDIQRQLDSFKDSAGGGPNVILFRGLAWGLVILFSIAITLLSLFWWRARHKGLLSYGFWAMLIVPFALGSVALAVALMDGLPEDRRIFPLTAGELLEFSGEPLEYLMHVVTIFAFAFVPAWFALAKANDVGPLGVFGLLRKKKG